MLFEGSSRFSSFLLPFEFARRRKGYAVRRGWCRKGLCSSKGMLSEGAMQFEGDAVGSAMQFERGVLSEGLCCLKGYA